MEKISIIIPIYNAEKDLKRCIDSVLTQSYQNFELILINDGSKDLSGKICQEYAQIDNRIKYFCQDNSGVSAARNHGIKKSTGTWISFIDADDYIEPGYCDIINQKEISDIDWIFNDVTIIKGGNEYKEWKEYKILSTEKEIKNFWSISLFDLVCQAPWAKFFRKSIIEKHHLEFDINIHFKEDVLFNLEYLKHIHSMLFSGHFASQYVYCTEEKILEYKKYKCEAKGITRMRDKIAMCFMDLGLKNEFFERQLFFTFTKLEHAYLKRKDDEDRKQFYQTSAQKHLENLCLKKFRLWDQWMYLSFKHLPHSLLSPVASLYLKYR